MPHSVPVSKVMIHRNQWPQFRASTTIKDAIRILRILSEDKKLQHGHDTPLVLDDSYNLLGYIQLTDLLRSVRHLCEDSDKACELGQAINPVSDLVKEFTHHVAPEDSILDALDIMTNDGIPLVPVIVNGKLKGLVKLSDTFNTVAHLLFDEEAEDQGWFMNWLHSD